MANASTLSKSTAIQDTSKSITQFTMLAKFVTIFFVFPDAILLMVISGFIMRWNNSLMSDERWPTPNRPS